MRDSRNSSRTPSRTDSPAPSPPAPSQHHDHRADFDEGAAPSTVVGVLEKAGRAVCNCRMQLSSSPRSRTQILSGSTTSSSSTRDCVRPGGDLQRSRFVAVPPPRPGSSMYWYDTLRMIGAVLRSYSNGDSSAPASGWYPPAAALLLPDGVAQPHG
jgi:hypothetical protein